VIIEIGRLRPIVEVAGLDVSRFEDLAAYTGRF
jgi:hypothetical protein